MGINGVSSVFSSAIDKVALNPQPLPPGSAGAVNKWASPFDKVSLNPQPLPPKYASLIDDFCGRKPKPGPGPWPYTDLGSFIRNTARLVQGSSLRSF
jgi:hypothetical protein